MAKCKKCAAPMVWARNAEDTHWIPVEETTPSRDHLHLDRTTSPPRAIRRLDQPGRWRDHRVTCEGRVRSTGADDKAAEELVEALRRDHNLRRARARGPMGNR